MPIYAVKITTMTLSCSVNTTLIWYSMKTIWNQQDLKKHRKILVLTQSPWEWASGTGNQSVKVTILTCFHLIAWAKLLLEQKSSYQIRRPTEDDIWWSCRHPHGDWRKEPGNNSKNNSLTWTTADHPYYFFVAKGSLFRKHSWSCSHFNAELFRRLLDKSFSKGS